MIERIKNLIANGETQTVEFKEAKNDFPKDAYSTVCAFLNSGGGTIILGVADDKTLKGINEKSIKQIKETFITAMNNPAVINPVLCLDIHETEIDKK